MLSPGRTYPGPCGTRSQQGPRYPRRHCLRASRVSRYHPKKHGATQRNHRLVGQSGDHGIIQGDNGGYVLPQHARAEYPKPSGWLQQELGVPFRDCGRRSPGSPAAPH